MKNKPTITRTLLFIHGLIILFLASCNTEKQPPNIIFIMSDDHATGAISAYGNSLLATPNLDKLAFQGMRFNNCFNVVSLCGPSRAAILSGRYGVHSGYIRNGERFDRSQITFPAILQQAGYETAIIGKWHLKSQPAGFDYYNVLPYQGIYYDCPMKETGQEWKDGNEGGVVQPGYITEVITDKAIEWLKGRDENKAFCLLVHHKAPHGPYKYPERYKELFDDAPLPEPENFYDQFEGKNYDLINEECGFSKLLSVIPAHFNKEVPDTLEIGTIGYKRWAYQNILTGYYRLSSSLDDNIGRLMDFIDGSGLKENTMVVYTSDNGWFLGDHGLFNKMWMYEESLHVPLIIRYPGEVEPGTTSDDFISMLDFAPTFFDYAGIEKNNKFQGQSIRPVLNGNTPNDWQSVHFYHYYSQFQVPSHYGIRTKDYKLIHFYEAEKGPFWEFYDLKNDPDEMVNVAHDEEYEDVFVRMKNLLEKKRTDYESS